MGNDTVKSLIFEVALFEFLILWVLIFTSSTNSIQFYLHLLFMNIKPWKKFHRTRFKWLNNWIGPQELKWFQIKVLPNNLQVPLTFFHITEGLLEDLVSPLGPVLLFLQLLQLDGHAANIGQSIILQPNQQSVLSSFMTSKENYLYFLCFGRCTIFMGLNSLYSPFLALLQQAVVRNLWGPFGLPLGLRRER